MPILGNKLPCGKECDDESEWAAGSIMIVSVPRILAPIVESLAYSNLSFVLELVKGRPMPVLRLLFFHVAAGLAVLAFGTPSVSVADSPPSTSVPRATVVGLRGEA